MRASVLGSLLLALALVAPGQASGQISDADRAVARSLGLEAQDALKRGEFRAALDLFQRADALYHAPTLLLGVARAQVGLGRLVAARESYLRLLREGLPPRPSDAFRRALADAELELARLEPRIPSLILTREAPPDARLVLDDQEIPAAILGLRRPTEPGPHLLQASADGFRPFRLEFTLGEGESRSIAVRLERLPPPLAPTAVASAPAPLLPVGPLASAAPAAAPPEASDPPGNWRRVAGWTGVGVGSAALLAGSIWGLVAVDRKAELDGACPEAPRCPSSALPLQRSYERAGNLSSLGFGVGLLGLGVGIPLLLLDPPRSKNTANLCAFRGQLGFCGQL